MARTTILNGDQGGDVRSLLNELLQRAVLMMDPVDLSANTFPEIGGTGSDGSVCKNDAFPVEVAGSPGGTYIDVGYRVVALVDDPGQDLANWTYY